MAATAKANAAEAADNWRASSGVTDPARTMHQEVNDTITAKWVRYNGKEISASRLESRDLKMTKSGRLV